MAEVTYRSAGVYTSEIDLTGPTVSQPVGTPAGVIGTTDKGRAFVPVTVGSYDDFAAVFGDTDGSKFGPLAVHQFLKNAQSLTYLRVLGVGNGKKRDSGSGKVTNAGFVVGNQQVQSNGNVGKNPYAVYGGVKGRTYFIGCLMSESAGSTVFSSAGLQGSTLLNGTGSCPIIRGVLMAPSGVILQLSGNHNAQGSDRPSSSVVARTGLTSLQGSITGTLNIGTQEFTMLLNGHKNTSENSNVITASFDIESAAYFANVFNTDPLKIEESGHLLYTHYDIHPALAAVTGTGVLDQTTNFGKGRSGTWGGRCIHIIRCSRKKHWNINYSQL